jgi:protocatechuate 3,4-dioxygenase beta subunit
MIRQSAVALVGMLLCASEASSQVQPPRTYTIAGVVINAATGRPARRVRVNITQSEVSTRGLEMTAGEDGRFRFDGIPPGKFQLYADEPGGIRHVYGETPGTGFGMAVVTGEDQRTDGLIFRLIPRGAIHGRIVDQNGDPVESALVQLYRSGIDGGRRRVRQFTSGYTDDHGEYRFAYLAAGDWYLVASGRPWYTGRLQSTSSSSPLARMGYPATFYPGTRDPRAATPLRLEAGQDLPADLTLSAAPGGSLELIVRGAQPRPASAQVGITFEGVAGSVCWERTEIVFSEKRLAGIPPGRYRSGLLARIPARGRRMPNKSSRWERAIRRWNSPSRTRRLSRVWSGPTTRPPCPPE